MVVKPAWTESQHKCLRVQFTSSLWRFQNDPPTDPWHSTKGKITCCWKPLQTSVSYLLSPGCSAFWKHITVQSNHLQTSLVLYGCLHTV